MDKIKDKVSVIIPVYNSEKTIVQVLDSVKRQTRFDYICEILVINDGSKDQSEELIQNYICEHSELPISYYSKENGGASSARNFGMRRAKGEYIAFLDSDDLWMPEKIEVQMKILLQHREIVFLGAGYEDRPFYIMTKRIDGLYKATIKDICKKNFPVTPSVVFKAEAIKTLGYFDEKQKFGEDINYYQKFCISYNYYYLPRKLVTIGFQKDFFGATGLTSHMKEMHLGTIKNLREVYLEGHISKRFYYEMRIFYWLKYCRRCVRRWFRDYISKGKKVE